MTYFLISIIVIQVITIVLLVKFILKHFRIAIEDVTEELNYLETQIESHRKALEFYADEKNYEDIGIPTGNDPPVLPVTEDRGTIAQLELKKYQTE